MKHASCGCCFQNLDYPRFTKSSSTYSAKQLLARGSKLCKEVSEMDALISSQSNFYSDTTEKPTSTEASTGTTILTDDDVPKVFLQSNSFEENLPPHSDTHKCSSFIQKIMDNAKTMLGNKYSVLHPSTCSEEPTRETDNCQYDSNATTFSSSRHEESKSFPKYTPSDYCLCDADNQDSSSKLDLTTIAETLPKEVSRDETLSSSRKTFLVDRETLDSIYSSDTNIPCSCSNVGSKDVLENMAKLHKELKCDYKHRDIQFDNTVKYFRDTSDEFDVSNCYFNKTENIYTRDGDTDKLAKDDGHCSSTGPAKSSASSEDVNVGLNKTGTSRRMFSLLDTTWLNPFRRDQPKKSNITNKAKLESRPNIDNNIPCRDVTCYRIDGGMRATSAEPCKREQTIHRHTNEECTMSGHISRTKADTVGDTNRVKAKSCDPTCTVCAKKKMEALNKFVVSTGCSPDVPTSESDSKNSYNRCDPNCPLCSHKPASNNDNQRNSSIKTNIARHHDVPERPPIVNASVGSAKVRNVVFDIIDRGTGAESSTTEHSPLKASTARFIEETPSNYKTLDILEDVCGRNSSKNDSNLGSQQESPCNSLSCQLSYTSLKQSKLSCKLSCPSINIDNKYDKKSLEKNKYGNLNEAYPSTKRVRSYDDRKDENNQCAFIGSPFLVPSNFKGTGRPSSASNPNDGIYYPVYQKCNTDIPEYTLSDKDRINDRYRGEEFDRARVKDRDFYVYNTRVGSQAPRYTERRYEPYGRHDGYINSSPFVGLSIDDGLERVARELKTENRVLKSELLEMKLELKHALEKVEGPMRSKLEAEKSRCEQLQHELQKASFDMKLSHDTFIKESEGLRNQLSLACSNKNQLEAINNRLRNEMMVLDELCVKLEEDLVNQKLNEAETLKRLARRNAGLNETGVLNGSGRKLEKDSMIQKFSDPENIKILTTKNAGDIHSATDTLNESNLNIIARKLSRTIKETEPCIECADLPIELTGAVKIIRDLTDMVEKRKAEKVSLYAFSSSRTNCSCQSPPCTEETACQCLAINDVGVAVSKTLLPCSRGIFPNDAIKSTKTLYSVPNTFVIDDLSSKNIVQDVRQRCDYPPVDRDEHMCTCTPSMKHQCTDPKTADKKIDYDPPRFAIEPIMVDKGINYETLESYKGDGMMPMFKDPNSNILTCYMVKTPMCPTTKSSSQDKSSKVSAPCPKATDCKNMENPPCVDVNLPCVKDVESNYISCEELDVSPCENLETPPCSDIGKPCLKNKNRKDPQDAAQQKLVNFSSCDEEESPLCESSGKPCTKGEVCEPTDGSSKSTDGASGSKSPCWKPTDGASKLTDGASGSKSPCWKLGVPCTKTSQEKPDRPKELLVEDLGISGDKEESEPLSSTYVDSLPSSTEPKTKSTCAGLDDPPCADEGTPCVEKNESDVVKQKPTSPCEHFGEPCVKKKRGLLDSKPDNKKSENEDDYVCEPCSADGPCSIVGRPCAVNEQTNKFNQMSGQNGPGISVGRPFDGCSQTIDTADKMTGVDPTINNLCSRIGSPCADRSNRGERSPGVATRTDNRDQFSADMHLVTTTVKEGNLEVKTEGPSGVIETTLNYLPDGDLEVQTHINELDGTTERQAWNPATASSSRGTSDLETSSYIVYPTSRYPYTQTDKLLAVFQCPQTEGSCAGQYNAPQSLAKRTLPSAATQGNYPRDTGITTDKQDATQKGTRSMVEKKSATACYCIHQLERTTSHTIENEDATAIPFKVSTRETPVILEDSSITSPQQTSQVQITSKSVGDEDTKVTIASSTLPIDMISKCECTWDLQSNQEITTENEVTSDQETVTDITFKEHSGTSPEKKLKKEASVTVKPTKADKQESKFAVSPENVDCGCQSTVFPADQSCQCCECKEIGVSTGYSESIQKTTFQDKLSVKSISDQIPDSPALKTMTLPDGTIQPVGTVVRPDGSILRPDGITIQADGTIVTKDGKTYPRGSILQPDGTILSKDGDILKSASLTVQPDGSVLSPDGKIQPVGTIVRPDGSVLRPDGITIQADGTIVTKDGKTYPRGSILQPDGTILSKDGEILKSASFTVQPDGSVLSPDGKIQPVGTIVRPDGSILRPDGIIIQTDGSIMTKDGKVFPRGSVLQPDGTVISEDGEVLKSSSILESAIRIDSFDKSGRESVIRPDGTFTLPDGTIGVNRSHPVGSMVQPDGSVLLPDGTLIATDGTVHPRGSIFMPDGSIVHPDGTKILADGTITAPDGSEYPKGSIMQPDGSVLRPDGSVVTPEGDLLRSGWEDSGKTSSKKPELQPDGTIIAADGSIQPIGSILSEDGNIIRPDGTVVRPDGSMVKSDGTIVRTDGTIIKPDGSVVAPDGTVHPVGTIVREDGSIIRPDGTIVTPDGIEQPAGSKIREDGSIQLPDGTVIRPEIGVIRSDGKVVAPDGSIHPKGSIIRPDGTIIHPDGSVAHSERLIRTIDSDKQYGAGRLDAQIEKYDSSDGSSKVKSRKGSKESAKRGSSEVPDLVSKLSSNVMPSSGEALDTSRPRKKRSSKLELTPCTCPGICNCIICSSDIMEKRKEMTGSTDPGSSNTKLCCCGGNPNKKPCAAEEVEPTQAYTFTAQTDDPHPKNCKCQTCRCDPCRDPCKCTCKSTSKKTNYDNICPDREQCRLIAAEESGSRRKKSRISIEDVFKPTFKKESESTDVFEFGHGLDCECIDCLCTPVMRDLCSTRQMQVRDEKQIYQVSTIKCVCPNTLKGSRIPVSTNPAVPKVKSSVITCTCDPCQCSPCSAVKESEPSGSSENKDDLPTTEDILKMTPEQLKDLCDCDPCACDVCFSKSGADDTEPCCCKPGCVCELCQVEEMKQQIEKLRQDIESLKPRRAPGQPDDCECETCICPTERPAGHPDDCECDKCLCPDGPSKCATPGGEGGSRPGHPPDCDCDICQCPLGPLKTKPRPPGHPPDCDCEICECPLAPEAGDMPGCTCGDLCTCPGRPKAKKEMQGCSCKPKCLCPGGPIPVCDCEPECFCSPCADPRKKPKLVCDCNPCECSPCADPSKQVQPELHGPNCTCATCVCAEDTEPEPHPDDCTCAECKCEGEEETKDTANQCDCVECKCDEDQPAADHPEGCTCDVCNCTPEDEFPHPEGCTCDVCKCTPPEEPTHPEGCTCDVCTCKPEESEPEPQPECICPDPCKCDEQEQTPPLGMKNCTCGDNCVCDRGDTAAAKTQADADAATMENAGTHPKECKCQECVCAEGGDSEAGNCTCKPCACTECYYKNTAPVQTKECQCSNCTCVDCSDPSKQGDSNTCKCSECKCDPCAFNPQPAIKCKCGVCTCIECEGKDASTTTQPPAKEAKEEKKAVVAGPLPKDRSCHCIECYCDECSNAKKQGSKARPEIVIKISPVKKNVTTETTAVTGEIKCTCLNCICIECLNKEMGGDKQDAEVHSIDCKCPTCTCVSCADTDSKVKDAECHCSTCQCPDCTSKSTEEHGENCKCPTCTCATCQDTPVTKDAECHCSTCKCPECSTKTAETHSIDCKCPTCTCAVCDDVPPLKKDAECHCSTCKCTECANKDGTLDPPPFELPQKIDCECATCQCIICSSKAAGKDSASPTNDETFQIPERIPCACQKCTCPLCNTEGQGQSGGKQVAAQFQVPERLPCVCKNCTCCICKGKVGDKGQSGSEVVEAFQVPERMPCDCKNCICIDCKGSPPTKDPQSGCNIENRPRGGGAFQPPTKMPCFCNTCQCVTCKFGMGSKMPTSALAGDIFEIPVRLPCQCSDPCKCIICSKNPVHDISAPTVTIKSSNIPATRPRSAPGGISTESCDCATLSSMCKCPECTAEKQRISAKVGSSTVRSNARVGVNQQTSFAGQVSKASFNKYSACVCVSCPDTSLKTETKDTSCIFSDSSACGKENVNLSTMDNATLAKKIASDARENCACKEQIKEIKSALTSIKSACTDAEKKAMKKPLIKQASDFNQTMSGLKLALTNLQEKCKAKDKMIYVMIGELRSRANSQTVMNVLNTCTGDAPDYDRAEDVKEKIGSNQLDSVSEEKQTFDEKIAKAVETERSSRKKKCKTCKCGKIHKNKNNKNVDLTGFEVVDIRKITHDSIIIKWKPPKSNLITGYDIFINGVNKSKVMSGGRTSAMIDSIDLSSTIQITIYAVTKCGRCEPPAIAIYEIVSQA